MRVPWSISTTVRNPERLRDFLKVLQQLEGEEFNKENQIKYQILLIQQRLYHPTNIPAKYKELLEDSTQEISYELAEEIFNLQDYKDPAMRGRQSANPLSKLGFAIARESTGRIILTELGKAFLLPNPDVGYIFFKSLLKLQFPNPWTDDFSSKKGFNIRPFIGTLRLIAKTKHLTREEFALFIPTLIDYKDISKHEEYIGKLREIKTAKDKDKFKKEFLKKFYGTKTLTETQIHNLLDYGDNSMRYFRLTKYFRVRKHTFGSWVIELEPARTEEIKQLLDMYDGSALEFEDSEEYIGYLSDIKKPELPWDVDNDKLKNIAYSLRELVKGDYAKLEESLKDEIMVEYDNLSAVNIEQIKLEELRDLIDGLRSFRLTIGRLKEAKFLRRNMQELKKLLSVLKDKKEMRELEPEEFEYIIFQVLKILNDEINIKPNCIFDDEGKPIGFAPGDRADIEGYYDSFNATFEVTLDVTRHQVYRESMPIMRHLRAFENKNVDKAAFCIFIAPRIHPDTVNYFWNSIKFGFEGRRQKIISLDLEQFVKVLEFFISVVEKNKAFSHKQLEKLFEIVIKEAEQEDSSIDWFGNTPAYIAKWQETLK
jgi:hypothetical protein